jgi:NUMOD3 motif
MTNINNTMNKYETWYAAITKRGQHRLTDSYTESHHIIPRSLGGNNLPENITKLTAREHFICHWLLTKIHSEGEAHWKMLNAIRIMRAENKNQQRYSNRITARVYSNLKEEYSKLQSERNKGEGNGMFGKSQTEKAKSMISKANTGRVQPLEEKLNQIKAITGRKRKPFTDDWKAKMSAAKTGENNNRYGVEVTNETRDKIRQKAIGRKQSAETIAKKADAIRGTKREKKLCPHCSKEVAVNGYARWHGDNCKSKIS